MTNTLKLLLVLALLVAVSSPAMAQSLPTRTTLSAALSGGTANNVISVTSASSITASTASAQTFCLVDTELVSPRTVNTTNNTLTVTRAAGGLAVPHNSGATITCGPGGGIFSANTGNTSGLFLGTAHPTGACTATANQYLPVFSNPSPGVWFLVNCNNGLWQDQFMPEDANSPLARAACTPIGIQSASAITSSGTAAAPLNFGVSTTPTTTNTYVGSIFVPRTYTATGVSLLNGLVGGTDKYLIGLYRSDGRLIANTATAGTTSGSAAIFTNYPFTATQLITGPARYWIAVQTNGTTTRIATVPLTPGNNTVTAGLGDYMGMWSSILYGSTFGTLPTNLAAFTGTGMTATTTVPTNMQNVSAPISCIY